MDRRIITRSVASSLKVAAQKPDGSGNKTQPPLTTAEAGMPQRNSQASPDEPDPRILHSTSQTGTSQLDGSSQIQTKKVRPKTADILVKMDEMLSRFQRLEDKVERVERKTASTGDMSAVFLHTLPSAHSSPKHHSAVNGQSEKGRKISQLRDTSFDERPSLASLQSDDRIQQEVEKRMRKYKDYPRGETDTRVYTTL